MSPDDGGVVGWFKACIFLLFWGVLLCGGYFAVVGGGTFLAMEGLTAVGRAWANPWFRYTILITAIMARYVSIYFDESHLI